MPKFIISDYFNSEKEINDLEDFLVKKENIQKLASYCGNQIREIIDRKAAPHILNKIIEVSALLDENMQKHSGENVDDPFFCDYLTQVSRYNNLTNQVTAINDAREGAPNLISLQIQGKKRTPIGSQFLKQKGNLKIQVTVNTDNDVFQNVNIYPPEQTGHRTHQYFYRAKTTAQGHPHQDEPDYAKANAFILKDTQKSNIAHTAKKAAKFLMFKSVGQGRDDYFKPADTDLHARELALFRNIKSKTRTGKLLTEEEEKFLTESTYYKVQSGVKFNNNNNDNQVIHSDIQVTHVGHANEIITLNGIVPLQIAIDPVNYQSGTEFPINIPANLMYPRKTDPAFTTDEEPAFNVVLISHNHHDHMCCQSLKELAKSNPETIYIVPAGDRKHMENFGIKNIIEFKSWDDYADITLSDTDNNTSTYRIAATPANHASNRSLNDFYESLYMGYMVYEVGKNKVVLCTGDTAVWDDIHFQQLENYLTRNQLTLVLSAIAHGPDRPRSQMAITHQSTADAVAMFARFQCMNLKIALENNPDLAPLEAIKNNPVYAIGYHQGCYRLGLLSLSDVDSTLLRMLSVLESLKECQSLGVLVSPQGATDLLKNNLQYNLLDEFEKTGLIDTLVVYQNAGFNISALTVKNLLCDYLNVPYPGERIDLSLEKPHSGIVYDYQRLILNRNPEFKHPNDTQRAYEKFATLNPAVYQDMDFKDDTNAKRLRSLIRRVFELYIKEGSNNQIKTAMSHFSRGALNNAPLECQAIKNVLAQFYKENLPTQDEGIRDESNHHTAMVILAGLIDDLGGFREQFTKVHHIINSPKVNNNNIM
ncbi:MAG: hypothetical protein HKM04_09350 [Legionellales bacterium]|nr:hypothetical protein [Legionellales bacterium]